MNFTPFGNTFPGNIPGLPQFTTSTAPLVSTVTAAVTDVTVTGTNNPQQQQQQDAAGSSNRYQQQQQQVTHFGQATMTAGQGSSGNKFRGGQDDAIQGDKYNGHLVASSQQQQQQQQQQQTQYATVAYASATATSAAADALQAGTSGQQQQQQQMQQQQVTAPQELTQDLCNAILQQQGESLIDWIT